jgi:surfeit locus 1 family protein
MPFSSRYDLRFWIVTLSALLMAGLTFSLGVWQLDRAAQKEKLSLARANVQPVRLQGQWLQAQTQYLDNRQMNGKQGFFVVTPLMTSNSEFVLVQRGWIARDFLERKKLQPIDTPTGTVTIEVRTIPDPVPPAAFASEAAKESINQYPIVQFIDLDIARKANIHRAYKGMAQQLGGPSEGMQRAWYEPAIGIEKNYGYAFQWFALCALLVGLYIWFQWIKR